MPVRATKRGAARVPFPSGADADVLICGASFAGLPSRASYARAARVCWCSIATRSASARPRPAPHPRSGCAISACEASIRQTFDSLLVRTPKVAKGPLAAAVHLLDVRLPAAVRLLWDQSGEAEFETAKVSGRTGSVVSTDRGDLRAPLIIDALGWRRVLGVGENVQPPEARAVAGSGGPPEGHGHRPRAVDRPALRRRRLRLVVPRPRRGAHRRRLVRPARPGQAADPAARRGRRRSGRTATRATGSPTACGRRPRTASSSPATARATACR